jgi:hypothetical protein
LSPSTKAAQSARVAFAPGLGAGVALSDLAEPKPAPTRRESARRSISRVLRKGDLARFRVLAAEPERRVRAAPGDALPGRDRRGRCSRSRSRARR